MSDAQLIRIVDSAMAEAARKSGSWLACRLGCTECCLGPFPITALDAERLRNGLAGLSASEPARAARVRKRAEDYVARLESEYPGNTVARLLEEDDVAEQEPCPALDPETGGCDLYAARPITCRTFGPPVRFGDSDLGICELCFKGATDEEIAACEVQLDSADLETEGGTLVGWALAG
jgi:Fe-S-cluster containining protein